MLLDLREKVRSSKPLKYSIITLISIPFVLVGIGSYFSGGTAASVAEVNGTPIDQQQLDRAYQQQRQQLARMFGGQLPEAFANEPLLREQALQQLITQNVLESEVAKQKFAVGDATLARAIRSQPNFQVDGQFSSEAYQSQLRASGMNVPAFEQSYRDNTALTQFQTGISDTAFTLPQEAQRLSDLGRQLRTVNAVRLDLQSSKETIEVSEEEIASYFDEQSDNYLFPERVKIQYIELDSSTVAADIDISEEQALSYYEDNKARYVAPERREASHILLESGDASEDELIEQLAQLKERVTAGESFADLAKEFSDDIGSKNSGGSLGFISPGAMVPEFEDAVSALANVGDISDPVVSDFGVHLIKLDSISAESGQAFEEVKDDIIATMQQDEADREFFDLRDLLAELSFDNPGSLDPAADATGLDIVTSDWLDAESDAGPVLSNPGILAAALSPDVLDDENNSDIISIDNRHVLVLRVAEYEDERPQTLEDVREEVVDALKSERASTQMSELASAALETLKAGESASVAATEAGDNSEAFESVTLDRQSIEFDRSTMATIFALPHPQGEPVVTTAILANGDQLALRLDSVEIPAEEEQAGEQTDPDSEPSDAQVLPPVAGVIEAGANPRLGATEFEVLLESLRSQADVEMMN